MKWTTFLLFLLTGLFAKAQTFTIQISIKDSKTGDPIIGAITNLIQQQTGDASDANGNVKIVAHAFSPRGCDSHALNVAVVGDSCHPFDDHNLNTTDE